MNGNTKGESCRRKKKEKKERKEIHGVKWRVLIEYERFYVRNMSMFNALRFLLPFFYITQFNRERAYVLKNL